MRGVPERSGRERGVPEPPDVFGDTADPSRYVPRAVTERLLAALEQRVLDERANALLSGPPGLGKTLLLRVLGLRLRGRSIETLSLPYSALSLTDLCAWALSAQPPGAPHETPPRRLRSRCRELCEAGSALLLLIDEADALPLETAAGLAQLQAECGAGLRLLLAGSAEPGLQPLALELGLDAAEFRLDEPLSETETLDYLRGRLRLAGAGPRLWMRFDRATARELHRRSEGIPRRLHVLAEALVRVVAPAPLSHWDIDPADLCD